LTIMVCVEMEFSNESIYLAAMVCVKMEFSNKIKVAPYEALRNTGELCSCMVFLNFIESET
jgi:hypothetical protein